VFAITEGLLIYLEADDVAALARDLHDVAHARWWLTDLASPRLLKLLEKRWSPTLKSGNAPFRFGPAEGTAWFAPHGWREAEFHSTWDGRDAIEPQAPRRGLLELPDEHLSRASSASRNCACPVSRCWNPLDAARLRLLRLQCRARPVYAKRAAQLGERLAREGLALVYGGGNVGLMGIVADAALAAGGEVIGVIPEQLVGWEVAHPASPILKIVANMHERKARMFDLSDAFVALPGGFGTLDEMFEMLTWRQLGLGDKPCAFLDVGRLLRTAGRDDGSHGRRTLPACRPAPRSVARRRPRFAVRVAARIRAGACEQVAG
jgi:uncharacterized protein (TIGR00730 family)